MSQSSEFRVLVEGFAAPSERRRPSSVQSDFYATVLGLLLEARIPALMKLAEATRHGKILTPDGLSARSLPSPNNYRKAFHAEGEGLPVGGVVVSLHRGRFTEMGEAEQVLLYLPGEYASTEDIIEADAKNRADSVGEVRRTHTFKGVTPPPRPTTINSIRGDSSSRWIA